MTSNPTKKKRNKNGTGWSTFRLTLKIIIGQKYCNIIVSAMKRILCSTFVFR